MPIDWRRPTILQTPYCGMRYAARRIAYRVVCPTVGRCGTMSRLVDMSPTNGDDPTPMRELSNDAELISVIDRSRIAGRPWASRSVWIRSPHSPV